MTEIKIIVVDDHQIVRDGIGALLMKYNDIKIVAEASNGEELMTILKSIKPDIVILDISMPKMDGFQATAIIKENYEDIQVIIFSSHAETENLAKAIELGVKGILPKNTMREELVEAIYTVAQNKDFISKYISPTALFEYIKDKKEKDNTIVDLKSKLSDREMELLQLIVQGSTNKEIADKLFISQRTVEKHKSNIISKLEMKSVVDLVKFAVKNKLVDLD
ncbi:MAG: response regulator transcription factor [Bacteroidales bacterium]|nr:response regulator transcription factor [Bacteroidales bacterium]